MAIAFGGCLAIYCTFGAMGQLYCVSKHMKVPDDILLAFPKTCAPPSRPPFSRIRRQAGLIALKTRVPSRAQKECRDCCCQRADAPVAGRSGGLVKWQPIGSAPNIIPSSAV